eukprot:m51a1_g229 hypothetical protein (802) ;mRNA; f:97054-101951
MSGNPFDQAPDPRGNPFSFDDPLPAQAAPSAPPAQPFNPEDVFGESYREIPTAPAQPQQPPAVAPIVDVPIAATASPVSAHGPESPKPRLEFHNFEAAAPSAAAAAPPPPPPSDTAGAILTTARQDDFSEQAAPQGEAEKKPAERLGWTSAWRPAYWQPYFDVDVGDVLVRMLAGGFWPFGKHFLDFVHPRADLYGPFWITTTLIFLIAAIKNMSEYIQYWRYGQANSWQYDFQAIVVGVGVLYGYVGLVPLVLWAASSFWLALDRTLVEYWCLYGYSLTIYLGVSFICIVPVDWLRWLLVGVGCIVSTFTLMWSLWKPLILGGANRFQGVLVISVCGVLHVALALVYKLYFFGRVYVEPLACASILLATARAASTAAITEAYDAPPYSTVTVTINAQSLHPCSGTGRNYYGGQWAQLFTPPQTPWAYTSVSFSLRLIARADVANETVVRGAVEMHAVELSPAGLALEPGDLVASASIPPVAIDRTYGQWTTVDLRSAPFVAWERAVFIGIKFWACHKTGVVVSTGMNTGRLVYSFREDLLLWKSSHNSNRTMETAAEAVPPTWVCSRGEYSDSVCSCNCGAWDPACTLSPRSPNCSAHSICDSSARCEERRYWAYDGCQCECGGDTDPDCFDPFATVSACHDNFTVPVCALSDGAQSAVCEVPTEWRCDDKDYNDRIVCDCNCGAYDPDCDMKLPVGNCSQGQECDGGLHCFKDNCSCESGRKTRQGPRPLNVPKELEGPVEEQFVPVEGSGESPSIASASVFASMTDTDRALVSLSVSPFELALPVALAAAKAQRLSLN